MKGFKTIIITLVLVILIIASFIIYEIFVPTNKLIFCNTNNESVSNCISIKIEKHYLPSEEIEATNCINKTIEECYN